MEVYRPKKQQIMAEHLECDVTLQHGENKDF